MMWTFALFAAQVDGISIQVQSMEGEVVVLCRGRRVESLEALLQAVPGLRREEHLTTYCRLANYLNTFTMFHMILEPETYRRQYAQARDSAGEPRAASRGYGRFDLSEVARPALINGVPVFYAESVAGGVPYQVQAPYPKAGMRAEMTYDPLPYALEDQDDGETEGAGGDHA